MLVEESREIVVVLDEEQRVVGASRRARESLQGLEEGQPLPPELVGLERGAIPLSVQYDVDGRKETLLYLSAPGDLAAYEELRSGFTAAVSHELRAPRCRGRPRGGRDSRRRRSGARASVAAANVACRRREPGRERDPLRGGQRPGGRGRSSRAGGGRVARGRRRAGSRRGRPAADL